MGSTAHSHSLDLPKVLLSRDVSSHPSTDSCNDNKGNEKKREEDDDEMEYHGVELDGGAH